MADVDPRVDDPLGDIGTVVHAAERLATWMTQYGSVMKFASSELSAAHVAEDARTILVVCKRLKGRL